MVSNPHGQRRAFSVPGSADCCPVDDVEQLAYRNRRRPGRVGALVTAAVRDHQMLGGCEQRVEQQLPILAAGILVTNPGVPGHEVVTVGSRAAREGPIIQAHKAYDAVRD
jgi:hypothetical protein